MAKSIELKSKNTKLPSKQTMNLYVKETDNTSPVVLVILAIFLAAMVFVIYKFGVAGRLAQLSSLENEVSSMRTYSNTLSEQLTDYDEILEQYKRYTKNFETEDEAYLASRTKVLDLVQDAISGLGSMESVTIKGNSASIKIRVSVLEDFATIRKRMEKIDWISNVTVTSAGTNSRYYSSFVNATGEEVQYSYVEGYIVFDFVKTED